MKTLFIFLVSTFIVLGTVFSQNILEIPEIQAEQGDTVLVPVEFNNEDVFVAFQLDLIFPEGIDLIESSITLDPERKDGHFMPHNITNEGVLRSLSFAIPTTPFKGSSGPILSFEVVTNVPDGSYEIEIYNPIFVSDYMAMGLNFGVINGVITVGEVEEKTEVQPEYVLQAERVISSNTRYSDSVIENLEVTEITVPKEKPDIIEEDEERPVLYITLILIGLGLVILGIVRIIIRA